MICTGEMLLDSYISENGDSSNLRKKLSRDVKAGKYVRLKRNLYETNADIPRLAWAQSIYGPSYVSFDYALSFYGIIPEYAYNVSCATFGKHKDKAFHTDKCIFFYSDVPKQVFPIGVECMNLYGYAVYIATMEKALCDKLYKKWVALNKKEFEALLFEDMRVDEEILFEMDKDMIRQLSQLYRSRNVTMLSHYLDTTEPFV